MLKRNQTARPVASDRPRLRINFNRKILSHKTLQSLKDALDSQGQLRGEAVEGVVDDLIKLRYLCENIVAVYDQGDKEKALEGIETLKLVI